MASLFGRAKINPGNVERPAGFEPATPRYHTTTTFVATLGCLWPGWVLN